MYGGAKMANRLLVLTAALFFVLSVGIGCGGSSGGGSGGDPDDGPGEPDDSPLIRISDININSSNVSGLIIQGECSQEAFSAASGSSGTESSDSSLTAFNGGSLSVVVSPVNGGGDSISLLATCIDELWSTEPIDVTHFHGANQLLIKVAPILNAGGFGDVVSLEVTNNFQCPEGYIAVPALNAYTTESFCVSKYEMKEGGQGEPTSQALELPFVVTKPEAQISCQSLGDGGNGGGDGWMAVVIIMVNTTLSAMTSGKP